MQSIESSSMTYELQLWKACVDAFHATLQEAITILFALVIHLRFR
jgi:hypothetical protein